MKKITVTMIFSFLVGILALSALDMDKIEKDLTSLRAYQQWSNNILQSESKSAPIGVKQISNTTKSAIQTIQDNIKQVKASILQTLEEKSKAGALDANNAKKIKDLLNLMDSPLNESELSQVGTKFKELTSRLKINGIAQEIDRLKKEVQSEIQK